MRGAVIFIAVALLMLVVAAAYIGNTMVRPLNLPVEGEVFDVPPGATVNGIARDLSRRDVYQGSPLAFRVYARLTAGQGHIKAGEYVLEPGLSAAEFLRLLRSGKVLMRQIRFVEGWTFSEWRGHLASEPGIEQTLADASASAIMKMLGKEGIHPEGQFFPDTYRFTRGETDLSILRRAHKRMAAALAAEWERGTRTPVLSSRYQALTLASIVEKETGFEPDRRKIAMVFLNRLARGMKLQSDPTVIYGIDAFDGNLTRADLARETPYNTYAVRGLPPTPICNPGLASIRATLNPEPHNYYYFVARGDGRSHFSETLEEHNEAVARYQKGGRVDDYRSSPPD